MAFVPSVIAFDVETALTDGTPSTEYYRDDFRVISAAFAWRGEGGDMRTLYLEGEDDVREFLGRVVQAGTLCVCHNYQFEFGVTLHRFPGLEGCISHDTMRLTQVADNGGKLAADRPQIVTYDDMLDAIEGDGPKPHSTGLSLVAAASRWLAEEWHSHKEPYYGWLRENAGVKKGHEGAHLTRLPPDMLEAYNVADAVVTLLLYETLTEEFQHLGYDYNLDHELYKSTARMVAKAKGVGARIDVAALQAYVTKVKGEVEAIEQAFRTRFAAEIERLEEDSLISFVNTLKTQKARDKHLANGPEYFNVGSNKQLRTLFVDVLGITPRFWTKEPKAKPGKVRKKPFVPSPSFKSAHLSTYGDGGDLLRQRRKRLLVLQQARALLKLAAYDGRWHFDLRACGTATGRLSGGNHA